MDERKILMKITRGKIQTATKVVIYGPEGIGKSTFASHFPNPLFIDTEGSTKMLDVARMEAPSSWTMLLQEIDYVRDHPDVYKTLVIDTADWAEQLCTSDFCKAKKITGIEDIGYGKGYVYLAEDFGRMLNHLNEVIERGIHVVITAHAQMRKFEQPDELGAYDRWELKLQKKTAPLLKEWADMVLFANYKTLVINVDNQGAVKGKNKAQGGQRVMYTSHHPCWDAKNRHGLPDELPFSFESIAHLFKDAPKTKVIEQQPLEIPKEDDAAFINDFITKQDEGIVSGQEIKEMNAAAEINEDYSDIPKALADLMKINGVSRFEIQDVVSFRGYYPSATPIKNYDPGFVQDVLVKAWDAVFDMIKERRKLNF